MIDISYLHCTFHYHGHEVLKDISFHIPGGRHTLIHGPVGAGKTMLLRSLAGTAQITSGTVKLQLVGREISKTDFHKKASLVEFAKPNKFFNPVNHFYQQRYHHQMEDDEWSKSMTIAMLLESKGFSKDDQKVKDFLAREHLDEHINNKLIHLSSGQRRKLQLIISLMNLPEILLLDAPYTGLDEHSRNDLNLWLQELANAQNLQVIIAANPTDAPEWMQHRVELVANGSASKKVPPQKVDLQQLYRNQKNQHDQQPFLELRNVNIGYDQYKVLDNISWAVHPGERVALMGDNGMGKSTLLSLIYADNPKAYSNNVRMFGVQRGKGDSIWSIKKRIGFVSSELHLYYTEKYSCAKVIATGFFDSKFIPRILSAEEHDIIEHYASYFGIGDLLEREYTKTSLGEQKLVLFIRALVKSPELLLLDEPYQAFSSELVTKANSLLDEIMKKSNTSLVFITHYREEIPACVQKIYQLKDGKLHREMKL